LLSSGTRGFRKDRHATSRRHAKPQLPDESSNRPTARRSWRFCAEGMHTTDAPARDDGEALADCHIPQQFGKVLVGVASADGSIHVDQIGRHATDDRLMHASFGRLP